MNSLERHNVELTHSWPLFQHLLSERLTSLGIMGAPEVPSLCRKTSVSRTANVGTWLQKRNAGHKWVKTHDTIMLWCLGGILNCNFFSSFMKKNQRVTWLARGASLSYGSTRDRCWISRIQNRTWFRISSWGSYRSCDTCTTLATLRALHFREGFK